MTDSCKITRVLEVFPGSPFPASHILTAAVTVAIRAPSQFILSTAQGHFLSSLPASPPISRGHVANGDTAAAVRACEELRLSWLLGKHVSGAKYACLHVLR